MTPVAGISKLVKKSKQLFKSNLRKTNSLLQTSLDRYMASNFLRKKRYTERSVRLRWTSF